jgi:hypothetical protein
MSFLTHPVSQRRGLEQHGGHHHFWERALTRGRFLGAAAGATGAVLGADLWMPALARAAQPTAAAPTPIPETISLPGITGAFHISGGPGLEPSTITDFNGIVGIAFVGGTGTGTDATGAATALLFDTDMRFMTGEYVGVDGKHYQGTFGFV